MDQTLYIVSDYGKLIKKGRAFHLKKGNSIIKTIFPHRTERLIILGKIEITPSAFKYLMYHNIDTIFLSTNGRFNGKLVFQSSKNVFLHKKQFEMLNNKEFLLKTARTIARGKIKNQLAFIQKIKRNRSNKNAFQSQISRIKANLEKLENTEDVSSIRGFEGNCSRLYFQVFKEAIKPNWANFPCRSMHPPKSNVNAVLSFLYTMILFRVDALILAEGLNKYVGYLHTLDYGKASLTYDLMEEYRVRLADQLTIRLFNLGTLQQDDFEHKIFKEDDPEYHLDIEDFNEENRGYELKGVLLTKPALRKVISSFEKLLDKKIIYGAEHRSYNFKQIIHHQITHFKNYLMGNCKNYKPFLTK